MMVPTGWLASGGSSQETTELAKEENMAISHYAQKNHCSGTAGKLLKGMPQIVLDGRLVGSWRGHPRQSWMGGRVTGLNGLAGASLRNCSKMAKSSLWEAKDLEIPHLQHFVLDSNSFPIKSLKMEFLYKN